MDTISPVRNNQFFERGTVLFRLPLNNMDATHLAHSARNAEQIEHNILSYSFQKEAYQGHKIEGDFLIDLILEKARLFQYLSNGMEITEKPYGKNAYIGIAVHHATDLHFIQGLSVMVTVIDANGYDVGKQRHFYHPRPGLHHYGSNWKLPGEGRYTLRVQIETPAPKWGEYLENAIFPKRVEVDFPSVMIRIGQQTS